MNRQAHDNVNFFHGIEVEHTPAHGMDTLFVIGVQDPDQILKRLQHRQHIFFGANHSFDPQDRAEWLTWERMILRFLDQGYLCSLDIPTTAVQEFNETSLCDHNNFIPQIRVSIPYVKLWNYNTMLKIDDRDFAATNPGVWCHSLHALMNRETFTDWSQYAKDEVME